MAVIENDGKGIHVRMSGLELLRIISMLLILACHYIQCNGFEYYREPLSFSRILCDLIIGGGSVGVGCFFLTSAWFFSDPDKELEFSSVALKAMKTWLILIFWSIPLGIIGYLLGLQNWNGISMLTILVKSFIPLLSGLYWYVSAYIVFLLLAPFMYRGLKSLSKQAHLSLLLVLFFLYTLPGGLYPAPAWGIVENNAFAFVYLYVLVCWLRWYGPEKMRGGVLIMCGLSLGVGLLTLTSLGLGVIGRTSAQERFAVIGAYRLPDLLISLGLFCYFKNLELKSRVVNEIASLTFDVYLVHCHPAIVGAIMSAFPFARVYGQWWMLITVAGISSLLFVVCAAFGLFRKSVVWKVVEHFEGRLFSSAFGACRKVSDIVDERLKQG